MFITPQEEFLKKLLMYDLMYFIKEMIRNKTGVTKKKIWSEFKQSYPDLSYIKNLKIFNKEILKFAEENDFIHFTRVSLKNDKGQFRIFQNVIFVKNPSDAEFSFCHLPSSFRIRHRKSKRIRDKKELKLLKDDIIKYKNLFPKLNNEKHFCKLFNINRSYFYFLNKETVTADSIKVENIESLKIENKRLENELKYSLTQRILLEKELSEKKSEIKFIKELCISY